MVNAYSILANNGRALTPTLIDYRPGPPRQGDLAAENWRACDGCNAPDWDGKPMPRPAVRGTQVIDAMTAYQMVHIAEGVIQRGTATVLRDLDRPMFGKTGTTTGPTDVWFVGGTPQIDRRRLYRLRHAAQPGRLCPGRHARRADLQGVRGQGV